MEIGRSEKETGKRLITVGIKRYKKSIAAITIIVCILLLIYFGMATYFMNHFYFGSSINGINVSGKSVEEVNKQMISELETYTLNLKERDNRIEQITAHEVGLNYNSGGQFKDLKDTQNPFKWISGFFHTEASNMEEGIKYDEELLKQTVDNLTCFNSSNIVEPKNPSIIYTDNSYAIIDGVYGNKVNKDILYEHVSSAILGKETSIDLDAINCYISPQFASDSQKIVDTKNMLNKYVSSRITYTFGNNNEIIDGSIINKWITIDDKFEVIFNEMDAKNYIEVLSSSYNTVGRGRNFVNSWGNTITIGGGDYGWSINKAKETQNLIAAIKKGQTIEKQPAYSQTAASHDNDDIGNTYVEIDLTKQHLWFYKNGSLIEQGDIVTGNVSANMGTPVGVYKLKYKERDAVLTGEDYASPVNFWMPFNGGIGIHDASWRSEFGGKIYETGGSHGCINSPYYLAKAIFDNIEAGIPVICYN